MYYGLCFIALLLYRKYVYMYACGKFVYMCVYVCMREVCVYVCMYVCMYVYMSCNNKIHVMYICIMFVCI